MNSLWYRYDVRYFFVICLTFFWASAIISPSLVNAVSPTQIPCATIPESAGTSTMIITIPTGGTYAIWSRMHILSEINNSYYVQIDSLCPVVIGDGVNINSWKWVNTAKDTDSTNTRAFTAVLSAGTHTVKIIGKDTNVKVDQLFLTQDLMCNPKEIVPACPGVTVTTQPTPTTSTKLGDIIGSEGIPDGIVDLLDFARWLCEYRGDGVCSDPPSSERKANLNPQVDQLVDLLDFSIWVNAFRNE